MFILLQSEVKISCQVEISERDKHRSGISEFINLGQISRGLIKASRSVRVNSPECSLEFTLNIETAKFQSRTFLYIA